MVFKPTTPQRGPAVPRLLHGDEPAQAFGHVRAPLVLGFQQAELLEFPEEQRDPAVLVAEQPQGVSGEAIPALEARYDGQGYGHLKNDVAEAVIEHFAPIRERHAALMADTAELDRLMAVGASRARAIAAPVLAEAKARVGLLPGVPT